MAGLKTSGIVGAPVAINGGVDGEFIPYAAPIATEAVGDGGVGGSAMVPRAPLVNLRWCLLPGNHRWCAPGAVFVLIVFTGPNK